MEAEYDEDAYSNIGNIDFSGVVLLSYTGKEDEWIEKMDRKSQKQKGKDKE